MSTSELVILVLAVVAVLLVGAALLAWAKRRKQTSELREKFGPEYDRTVENADKRKDAERDLAERKARHDSLDIRPLSDAARQRYLTSWEGVQGRFVDAPVLALSEADALLTRLLAERGFPTDDVRTQEDMLSVEHARLLDGFRAGHAIEQQNSSDDADTEQVRQGMLHFREVFEELVSEGGGEANTAQDDSERQAENR